jgi:hypothetical protein
MSTTGWHEDFGDEPGCEEDFAGIAAYEGQKELEVEKEREVRDLWVIEKNFKVHRIPGMVCGTTGCEVYWFPSIRRGLCLGHECFENETQARLKARLLATAKKAELEQQIELLNEVIGREV